MAKVLNIKRSELEFLRGPEGKKGDSVTGERGPVGPEGPPGQDGKDGKDGVKGLDGLDGIKGAKGTDGLPGIQGTLGNIGAIGPAPKHEWKNTSLRFQTTPEEWGKFVDLKGDKGDLNNTNYYPGGSGSPAFKAVTVNRDVNDLITSVVQGNKTWTITRDGSDCITSVTDGATTRTLAYTNNKVTSVTIS